MHGADGRFAREVGSDALRFVELAGGEQHAGEPSRRGDVHAVNIECGLVAGASAGGVALLERGGRLIGQPVGLGGCEALEEAAHLRLRLGADELADGLAVLEGNDGGDR